ncbi:hypothetical protein MOTC310_28545 [Methylobacterium oryzae]|uniref:Uncharacterized protein n=1 Tax=Methylobacterium oryzae TaxID=334852 RepID=A0ABU7TWC5_9HYPH
MTTPEASALGLPGASPGDLAHADLVGRLAREIYGQGQEASQPVAPRRGRRWRPRSPARSPGGGGGSSRRCRDRSRGPWTAPPKSLR